MGHPQKIPELPDQPYKHRSHYCYDDCDSPYALDEMIGEKDGFEYHKCKFCGAVWKILPSKER